MFVCIVMDFYEAGDLDNVIRKQRSKETPLPEAVLKKWFGQMVEAIAFFHDQKVIHRDLKPSNIFMTNDLDVRIGDFGVATVMDGARTRTRTTVGALSGETYALLWDGLLRLCSARHCGMCFLACEAASCSSPAVTNSLLLSFFLLLSPSPSVSLPHSHSLSLLLAASLSLTLSFSATNKAP